jgi:hypothetical protein
MFFKFILFTSVICLSNKTWNILHSSFFFPSVLLKWPPHFHLHQITMKFNWCITFHPALSHRKHLTCTNGITLILHSTQYWLLKPVFISHYPTSLHFHYFLPENWGCCGWNEIHSRTGDTALKFCHEKHYLVLHPATIAGQSEQLPSWQPGWMAWVQVLAVQDFSLLHSIHSDSRAHPTSYPMGTRGFVPGSKAAGAWSWPDLQRKNWGFVPFLDSNCENCMYI